MLGNAVSNSIVNNVCWFTQGGPDTSEDLHNPQFNQWDGLDDSPQSWSITEVIYKQRLVEDMFERCDWWTRFDGDSPTNCESVFCSRSTPAPYPLGFRPLAAGSTKPSLRACFPSLSSESLLWLEYLAHEDSSWRQDSHSWHVDRWIAIFLESACCWFVNALRRGALEREQLFFQLSQ